MTFVDYYNFRLLYTRYTATRKVNKMNTPAATIKNVNKSFSDKKVLKDVSLTIKSNQVLAILGPNGAGKTTLINILLGQIDFDSGQASIFGQAIGSIAVKRCTGAMLQIAGIPDSVTVSEHIRLFQSYYPSPMDYEQVLEYAGLQALQSRYSKNLSGGEKQRLMFAIAICGNPQLLFLDEPTTGMDIESRRRLWQAITDLKNRGTAIVLTTHYLEEAELLADQVVMLNNGCVIKQGTTEEIKSLISNKVIRFITKTPTPQLTALPAISHAKQSGNYIELQSTDTNISLPALYASGIDIKDLTVSGAALEDAFLHYNAQPSPETMTEK